MDPVSSRTHQSYQSNCCNHFWKMHLAAAVVAASVTALAIKTFGLMPTIAVLAAATITAMVTVYFAAKAISECVGLFLPTNMQ